MKILFLCVANSARSQMAEGLAKDLFQDKAEIHSAGSQPGNKIQPDAIEALKEIGVDISKNHPKFYGHLPFKFLAEVDYVITLCAEEVCSLFPSQRAKQLHWPIPDPVTAGKTEGQRKKAFRDARDFIREKLRAFAKEHDLA